jgi:hypothetical protein
MVISTLTGKLQHTSDVYWCHTTPTKCGNL